jgi:hypothetical protein
VTTTTSLLKKDAAEPRAEKEMPLKAGHRARGSLARHPADLSFCAAAAC